jgi:hypothetical protein
MAIVRRPDKATGGITDAEKVALDAHAKKWIANAMNTAPVDPVRISSAVRDLYRVSGLKEPRVVVVSSPRIMAFAGGFASAILWLRKNKAPPKKPAKAIQSVDPELWRATDRAIRAAIGMKPLDQSPTGVTFAPEEGNRTFVHLADTLAAEFGGTRDLFMECAANWWRMYQGGNMWSSWDCYLTAFRDVIGLRLPEYEKYAAWEACAIEGGFRFMHEEFCIVSDRPDILTVDERNRPHGEAGPSHRWRDGWSLYYWHGVQVNKQIVEHPETITVAQIRTESNAEVRRVMTERYGYERYCADAKLEKVDECPADHPIIGLRTARLWRDDGGLTLLDVLNSSPEPDGSVRRYVIAVDAEAYDGRAGRECLAASASTWRKRSDPMALFFPSPEAYSPILES